MSIGTIAISRSQLRIWNTLITKNVPYLSQNTWWGRSQCSSIPFSSMANITTVEKPISVCGFQLHLLSLSRGQIQILKHRNFDLIAQSTERTLLYVSIMTKNLWQPSSWCFRCAQWSTQWFFEMARINFQRMTRKPRRWCWGFFSEKNRVIDARPVGNLWEIPLHVLLPYCIARVCSQTGLFSKWLLYRWMYLQNQ